MNTINQTTQNVVPYEDKRIFELKKAEFKDVPEYDLIGVNYNKIELFNKKNNEALSLNELIKLNKNLHKKSEFIAKITGYAFDERKFVFEDDNRHEIKTFRTVLYLFCEGGEVAFIHSPTAVAPLCEIFTLFGTPSEMKGITIKITPEPGEKSRYVVELLSVGKE